MLRALAEAGISPDVDACPASVYQRFVLGPGNLPHEDTSCAAQVSPIHTVGACPPRWPES